VQVQPVRSDAVATQPMEARIVAAAVDLFSERGVDGTSLQVIADALGITKGAVYYHFKTKHAIIAAVYADALGEVEATVAEAEAIESSSSREQALAAVIPRLVTLAVDRRAIFSRLRFDPVVVRMMSDDEAYDALLRRLDRVFSGDDPSTEDRVRAAAVVSTLAGVPVHHAVSDLDDETLRVQLTAILEQLAAPTFER
jgi:AcrR family transcriptional regulator